METVHKSVLLQEVITGLDLKDGATLLDGTFGGGGHTKEILQKFPNVKVIGIDADGEALERWREKFGDKVELHNTNFRKMDEVLGDRKVDAVLLDVGLSSDQLENSGRGFSFMKDEPLLMTLKNISGSPTSMKENPSSEVTANDVVNSWQEENLEKIIRGYGEEKYAKRIARRIVEAREDGEIKTTFELAKIIESAVGGRHGKVHPATKTFQAIRIAVNDELRALDEGVRKGFAALNSGGRMAVISFHSLEDRIVKNFYKEKAAAGEGILITKRPIVASDEEIQGNKRSRSAKLRIIQKI
jgi:16S rRNA (cytosine1402-N4)-methyltransferase